MYLEHASYRYPTHLVPLLDLGLTVLVLLLTAWVCRRSSRSAGSLVDIASTQAWTWARRISSHMPRTLVGLLLLGIVASAASELALGPPVPRVVDEFSYLYAAETFAHGELSHPTHRHWRHFQAVHVLSEPTTQSKYPPAQGLVLALGASLGHPSASLWLMTGLLTAAIAWLLHLWLPPPWPLIGALAVLFRIGVGSYWNQSYWGGSVAAVAGILVFGGVRACMERPTVGRASLLGLGVLVLANSRPFEGLLFALPFAGGLTWWLVRPRTPGRQPSRAMRWRRVGLPLLMVLAVGALTMGRYHEAVTGDPLRLPHLVYSEVYEIGSPHFLWSADMDVPWWRIALALGVERTTFSLFFYLGLLGCLFAAAALPTLRGEFRGKVSLCLGVAAATLVLAGHFLTRPWFVHYSAPMTGVAVLLAILGLRRLTSSLHAEGRAGRLLPLVFVAAQVVLCLAQLPAHRPDADSTAGLRQAVFERLVDEPGRDLVFLCSPPLRDDWMLNPPDFDEAPVLWARELAPDDNEALEEYFRDRSVWHLEQSQDGITLRRSRHDGEVVFALPGALDPVHGW